MLTGDEPSERHEGSGRPEAAEITDLGKERHGGESVDAAKAAKKADGRVNSG